MNMRLYDSKIDEINFTFKNSYLNLTYVYIHRYKKMVLIHLSVFFLLSILLLLMLLYILLCRQYLGIK